MCRFIFHQPYAPFLSSAYLAKFATFNVSQPPTSFIQLNLSENCLIYSIFTFNNVKMWNCFVNWRKSFGFWLTQFAKLNVHVIAQWFAEIEPLLIINKCANYLANGQNISFDLHLIRNEQIQPILQIGIVKWSITVKFMYFVNRIVSYAHHVPSIFQAKINFYRNFMMRCHLSPLAQNTHKKKTERFLSI